jgi:hypothetical protein
MKYEKKEVQNIIYFDNIWKHEMRWTKLWPM